MAKADPCKGRFVPMRLSFSTPGVPDAREVVVGRAELADSLWANLEGASLRLLSERRMGKTWLLKLALACAPDWSAPMFFDAEQAQDACDFVLRLNRQLHASGLVQDNWWKKTQEWFQRLVVALGGKKLGPVEVPSNLLSWSAFLTQTCQHVIERKPSQTVVLIFDELPLFLDKLITSGRPTDAVEFLDTLRFLRQNQPTLRMVFCGSLGLHIVLKKLETTGYTGRPVNDMNPFDVPPLTDQCAAYLAGCLITGENALCKDVATCATAVAKAGSRCPFYIQKIVKWMKDHADKAWTTRAVATIVEQAANGTGDPFEFSYYEGRLPQYYPEDADLVDRARITLDVLSRESDGLPFDDLLNRVRHNPKTLTLDPEALLEVLRILRDDHYLVECDRHWAFKLDVIRLGWYHMRGRQAL
jgi:hypothetical protein